MVTVLTNALTYFAATPCKPAGFKFLPTWYKYLPGEEIQNKCTPIFRVEQDIPLLLLAIFEMVLFLGGFIAVAFIIYGGFQYMLSQGEPERAKNARTTIINALVGLIITIMAAAITNFIARNIA